MICLDWLILFSVWFCRMLNWSNQVFVKKTRCSYPSGSILRNYGLVLLLIIELIVPWIVDRRQRWLACFVQVSGTILVLNARSHRVCLLCEDIVWILTGSFVMMQCYCIWLESDARRCDFELTLTSLVLLPHCWGLSLLSWIVKCRKLGQFQPSVTLNATTLASMLHW